MKCKMYILFQVLHLYLFLGVQDLFRVWFHVFGILHPDHCNDVCYHCLYIFLAKCRGLSLVSTNVVIVTCITPIILRLLEHSHDK